MRLPKIALLFSALAFVIASCENEMDDMNLNAGPVTQSAVVSSMKIDTLITLKNPDKLKLINENLRDYFVKNNAVEATDCGPTQFVAVQNKYIGQLGKELVPVLGGPTANYLFGLYMDINFISAYLDKTKPQYFGEKGAYTNFMTKRTRELGSFWNMSGQIQVNGQHNATLNDRNKVGYILYTYFTGFASKAEAYEYADMLVSLNTQFATLPESPFFSVDGFATSGNLIVIGDGIVKMASEAGNIAEDVVWTGILAHEWAHQIQFDYMNVWYPTGAGATQAGATRHTELEADFLAAYYMTHKRGATYNWKRAEQFFKLFFQIGDCSFDSPGHHGTPAQRMEAARLGYKLANSAQKQGQILTAKQLHTYYMINTARIL